MENKILINNVELFYTDNGPKTGKPVVLMHGWGCDHTTVNFIESCISSNYRVINVDLPGHGQSGEPPEVWGVEEFTCLIESLISKLNLERPSLIGHSFGGRIAILAGSRNDIDKIVLVDAAGVKPKRPLSYYRKVYSFKIMKRMALLMMGKRKGENFIENLRKKKGSADYAASSPMMRRILSKCVNEDLKYCMSSIKAPTLLIWGENDTATPLNDAKIMERLIPDSGLVSFPNCGHYSFLDNPSGFKAVLKNFFE